MKTTPFNELENGAIFFHISALELGLHEPRVKLSSRSYAELPGENVKTSNTGIPYSSYVRLIERRRKLVAVE